MTSRIAAFNATTYRVQLPDFVSDLRIGCAHPILAAFFTSQASVEAIWISASNPNSTLQTEAWNIIQTKRLATSLQQADFAFFPSSAIPDDALWPPERAYLVLGMTLIQGKTLARTFHQEAFLWLDAKACPQLIFTDAAPTSC